MSTSVPRSQVPYEETGRTRQKARTRAALVAAVRGLLAAGDDPTVERAADRAGVSRTTAYRYFPNRRALLAASYPEIETASLVDSDDAPSDPRARLDAVIASMKSQLLEHEPELRAQLRLALEPGHRSKDELPLRKGRVIGWLEDALAPLRAQLSDAELRRLILAIRATLGIEALVWLTDVGGVSRDEALEIMGNSARTLLDAAVARSSE